MRDYLVPEILPAYEVHLFAGPSGAGKTTLLFQWIKCIKAQKPIFGKQTHNLNIAYVAYDRSELSIQETMNRVGITQNELTWKSLRNQYCPPNKLPDIFPEAQLIVIDAIGDMPIADSNKGKEVSHFLAGLGNVCIQRKVTMLGILHCAKTKENERYLNPRQRISGSKAWAAYSDTIFILEPLDAENTKNKKRKLFILPRNSAEFEVEFSLTPNGTFIETLDSTLDDNSLMILELLTQKPLSAKELECQSNALGMARRTMYRTLHELNAKNLVQKVGTFWSV